MTVLTDTARDAAIAAYHAYAKRLRVAAERADNLGEVEIARRLRHQAVTAYTAAVAEEDDTPPDGVGTFGPERRP